jgi:putative membrane protein
MMQPEPVTPLGQPAAAEDPEASDGSVLTEQPWLRLDARMLLVHPIIELRRLVPALAILLFAGRSSGHSEYWGLGATALVILAAVLRWVTTRYRITPERLQLRRGLIRRTTIDVRRERIRTVDVTAHALHRMLGLAKVVIGTGTSDRRGAGGLELDGLSAAYAQSLRAELLHRPAADATPDERARGDYEYEIARLSPSWVRYAPFTLSGLITAAAVIGFGFRLVQQAQINLKRLGPLQWAGDEIRSNAVWLDILVLVLVVVVFAVAASTVGYVLSYWDFRLTRHLGGSLHISRGLITSRRTSIERSRLAGVELSETLLLRMVGGARCLTIATGLRMGRGSERGGTILLPAAPRSDAVRVAAAVLETDAPLVVELRSHGPRARRRRYLRANFGAVVITAIVGVVSWAFDDQGWWLGGPTIAVFVVTVIGGGALARDRYRSLGHGWAAGYLVSRFGSIVRRHNNLSVASIIGWNMRASIWQRRVGLLTLVATTAAGRQKYPVPDVDRSEAVRFVHAGTPALIEQFLA